MTTWRLAANPSDHKLGNPEAPFTLIEYGDFECHHCRIVHPLIKKLLIEKRNNLHFVFRNFPLREIHPHAYVCAIAAEAAGRQGKFWQMHDLILENQEIVNTRFLLSIARDIGLNLSQFDNDLKSKEVEIKIEEDYESGICNGVNRTPTFFLNGLPVMAYDKSQKSSLEHAQLESGKWHNHQNRLSIQSFFLLNISILLLTILNHII